MGDIYVSAEWLIRHDKLIEEGLKKEYEEKLKLSESKNIEWNKLKEFISTSKEVLLYSSDGEPHKIGDLDCNYFERRQLLEKMNELEEL